MFTQEMRDQVEADRPRAFRVLDWPEMRMLFEEIDQRAKTAKRKVRNTGTQAVLVAASGLALAALASWLAPPDSAIALTLGLIAALMLIGGVIWEHIHACVDTIAAHG